MTFEDFKQNSRALMRYYSRRPARPLAALLLWGVLPLFTARPIAAQTTPDWTQYNVPFSAPPVDGNSAAATFPQRAKIELEYLACGSENSFLATSLDALTSFSKGNTQDGFDALTGDGYLGMVMAKLEWLKLHPAGCDNPQSYIVAGSFYEPNHGFPNEGTMEAAMKDTFPNPVPPPPGVVPDCGALDVTEQAQTPSAPNSGPTTVLSKVLAPCLKNEIYFALSHIQEGDRYPGSDGLPCISATPITTFEKPDIKLQPGDWDAKMKSLIRILFLDSLSVGDTGSSSMLANLPAPAGFPNDSNLREYVQNELITVDGPPGADTTGYHPLGCGDHEKDTGSPQDREDETDFSNGFWNSLSGLLCWLKITLLGAAALAALSVVAPFVPVPVGGIAAVVAALGAAVALTGTIPETENHQLMIESTRFLNNQLIIQALGPDNTSGISLDQMGNPATGGSPLTVKSWLLTNFQHIAEHDFREYNARPYTAYSLTALRNLADFSTDVDVQNGAQMLLEYSEAKFSLGSNQGRRLVPFRRRLPAVKCILGAPQCDECYTNGCANPWFEIFHPKAFEDHEVSLGLLLNGQTQQLLNGRVALDVLDASAATTRFMIDPLIIDLAIRKDVPYLQTVHHAGYEIYSSSPNALITAGGIQTDHADHFTIGGVPWPSGPSQDLGGGLPTTVMFTGDPAGVTNPEGQSRMTIQDYVQFQGNLKPEGSDESFDDNLCVWANFACGLNVQVPPDLTRCLVQGQDLGFHWFFFDSSNSTNIAGCDGYKNRLIKFYFALYLICPLDNCVTTPSSGVPPNSAGFLEIVDNPSVNFPVFSSKVFNDNPFSSGSIDGLGKGCVTGGNCDGHYHTANLIPGGSRGYDLEIDLRGHQDDSEKTGIVSIDEVAPRDLDDRNFLDGNILTSKGDGVILINNPRLNQHVVLDFSDVNHPCRRQDPGSACLPPL